MKKIKTLYEHEETEIKELLFGRKIEKVSEDTLILDNGLVLEIKANDG
jgi:hypothetical protein